MSKIRVNKNNSTIVDGKLFITGLKMSSLTESLKDFIKRGSIIEYPQLGILYEYTGPFTRV